MCYLLEQSRNIIFFRHAMQFGYHIAMNSPTLSTCWPWIDQFIYQGVIVFQHGADYYSAISIQANNNDHTILTVLYIVLYIELPKGAIYD